MSVDAAYCRHRTVEGDDATGQWACTRCGASFAVIPPDAVLVTEETLAAALMPRHLFEHRGTVADCRFADGPASRETAAAVLAALRTHPAAPRGLDWALDELDGVLRPATPLDVEALGAAFQRFARCGSDAHGCYAVALADMPRVAAEYARLAERAPETGR